MSIFRSVHESDQTLFASYSRDLNQISSARLSPYLVTFPCHLSLQKGAGSALVTAALERASEQCGMTLEDMQSLPLGRQRRSRHDDTTALVMWL
jgi:hypothetical protein